MLCLISLYVSQSTLADAAIGCMPSLFLGIIHVLHVTPLKCVCMYVCVWGVCACECACICVRVCGGGGGVHVSACVCACGVCVHVSVRACVCVCGGGGA